MALVSRMNREVAELQAVDSNGLYSTQNVDNIKGRHVPAIDDLDAQDDVQEPAPIVLLTDAQRRTLDHFGSKGKRVQYNEFDETPASEGEEYTSSEDDTLAAGSGMGSSTHSFFGGETSGAVGASEDARSDDKTWVRARGCAGHDIHDIDDDNEHDEYDEDDDYNVSDVRERHEVFRIDEFGVIRSNGGHGGYEDHTTIRARLVPSEAPRVLRRSPSKKLLRVLRNILGIKQ